MMTITTGYLIPGSKKGGCFTLPDFCQTKISDEDINRIAEGLRRTTGREPVWQTVRGKAIQLAKSKGGAA
jgi:hypothetical protein